MQFVGCCCGIFCDFLDELSLHPWRNFGRPESLGRLITVLCLEMMALTVVQYCPTDKNWLHNPFQNDFDNFLISEWLMIRFSMRDCNQAWTCSISCV